MYKNITQLSTLYNLRLSTRRITIGTRSKARSPFIDMRDRSALIRGDRESDWGKRLRDRKNASIIEKKLLPI